MPVAPGLTVSAHLEGCAVCKGEVSLLEQIGEALITQLPDTALDPGALGRALLAIDRPDQVRRDSHKPSQQVANLELPHALGCVGLERRRWLAPGMWVARARAPEIDGWRTFLVCLPAGGRIPAHCHKGGELVAVLKGSFNDGDGWRTAGDFSEADAEVEHELSVSSDGPCICMISTQAPIQWRGWAKLINPILGL